MKKPSAKTLAPVIVMLLLGLAILAGYLVGRSSARREALADNARSDWQTDDEDWQDTVVYQGREYVRNRDIRTLLFLGIDDAQVEGELIGKGGRSDVMLLLLLDQRQYTVRMLEISRDTILEVDAYNTGGEYLYSTQMQLCMQYSFGDSPARSCYLTRGKVSQLLYGLPVDYCCALRMEGIQPLVDGVGGISVVMQADCTDIDPAYEKGAVVQMDGQQAERFLRFRDTLHSGGNEQRMERQNWFLLEIVRQLQGESRYTASELLEMAEPYLETDLDASALALLQGSALNPDSVKLPGENRLGSLHDEYYVDDEALQALLIELFYLPKET